MHLYILPYVVHVFFWTWTESLFGFFSTATLSLVCPSSCSGLMAEAVNSYIDVWLCFVSFWNFSKRFQSCHLLMKKHQHLLVSVSWFSLLFFKRLVHAHLTSDIKGMLSSCSLWGHDGTCPRLNWWRHGSSAKSSLYLSAGTVYIH